jgi:hypothetical protein
MIYGVDWDCSWREANNCKIKSEKTKGLKLFFKRRSKGLFVYC